MIFQLIPQDFGEEWHWTITRYQVAIAAGLLTKNDAVELLAGKLYKHIPEDNRHAATIRLLTHYFTNRLSKALLISPEQPIALGETDSQPEPNLVVCRHQADYYSIAPPKPNNILLTIEVAENSLIRARHLKAPLYARSLLPEYWIINLKEEQVEIYTQPSGERYGRLSTHARGTTFESPFNGLTVVDELFPG